MEFSLPKSTSPLPLTIASESSATSRTTSAVKKVRASKQYTVFKFVCASTWKGAKTFKCTMTSFPHGITTGVLSPLGL